MKKAISVILDESIIEEKNKTGNTWQGIIRLGLKSLGNSHTSFGNADIARVDARMNKLEDAMNFMKVEQSEIRSALKKLLTK